MSKPSIPALPCICASFRRASRALTQRYDEALRPLGLTGTQFTILQVFSFTGEIPQGKLGEILAMDSTTLTRTLKIMSRHRWISTRSGKDRRERWLRLTPSGEAEFRRALPRWEKVQEQLHSQLGEGRWKTLMNLINEVTSTATE